MCTGDHRKEVNAAAPIAAAAAVAPAVDVDVAAAETLPPLCPSPAAFCCVQHIRRDVAVAVNEVAMHHQKNKSEGPFASFVRLVELL